MTSSTKLGIVIISVTLLSCCCCWRPIFCIKNIVPVLCLWSLALIDSVSTHNICSGQYHITWFPPLYRRVTPTITREEVCNTFKGNTFTEKIMGICCEFQNMHGCVVSFLELNSSSRKKEISFYKLTSPNSQSIFLLFMLPFHGLRICHRQSRYSIKWKKAGLGWRNPEWCVLDTRIGKRNMRWQNKWDIYLGQEDRSKPDTPKANQT